MKEDRMKENGREFKSGAAAYKIEIDSWTNARELDDLLRNWAGEWGDRYVRSFKMKAYLLVAAGILLSLAMYIMEGCGTIDLGQLPSGLDYCLLPALGMSAVSWIYCICVNAMATALASI